MKLTDKEKSKALALAVQKKLNKLIWMAKQNRVTANGATMKLPTVATLTDSEQKEVLDEALRTKIFRTEHEALLEAGRAKREEAERKQRKEWDYRAFLRLMRAKCNASVQSPLIENKDTLELIKTLCFRFGKDERYETELGFSFQKGLILAGSYGLGKSFLVDLIKDNPVDKVQIITMPEIRNEIKEHGVFNGIGWSRYDTIYLDDVGKEFDKGESVKHYGTDINWFKDFIEGYYTKCPDKFHRIMFSTNDNIATLEKKYGAHVRDRLAQKFDVLNLTGTSMRR